MGAILCSTVNDLFERETNRFNIDIQERYRVQSPWGRLLRVGKFPQQMGTTITEETIERVLSGSFETDWTSVGTSNGSASNGCVPATNDLQFGQTLRTWNLMEKAYQTPCICLDDLKTSFQIENQVAKTVRSLTQLTQTVLDNRRRSEYLRQVGLISSGDTTLTVNGAGSSTQAAVLAATPLPTAQLSQDDLDELRVQLIRDGAAEDALGVGDGQPMMGLIISPEGSRQLLRNNPELRQDTRYAEPSQLVAPLGVKRDYLGFYHLADFEAPRFDYINGTYVQQYPFVQVATSNGIAWNLNPGYNTAAYEVAYIFHRNVYEEAVQQVGPNIPGAAFDDYPYYYSGQFFWLNIRDAANNPLGKVGRWLAIFQNGTRPLAPYLGRAILYSRCPNDASHVGCAYPYNEP
jgi:hypothetical protein